VAEVPLLKELYGKYQERGLEIIGISLDDEPAKVERFVAQNDILWPEICDGKADAGAIPKLYNVSGTPDLYAIDRAGNIAARLSSAKQLDRQLAALTASAAARSTGPQSPEMAQGSRLDQEGRSKEAKAAFQKAIDNAATPAATSEAQRRMAISYAFDGDCKNAVKYEEMVIAYWQSQEKEAPGSAFYQQGEIANQAARICIDSDDLTEAERMYLDRGGTDVPPRPGTRPEGAGRLSQATRTCGNSARSTLLPAFPRARATRTRRRSTSPPRRRSWSTWRVSIRRCTSSSRRMFLISPATSLSTRVICKQLSPICRRPPLPTRSSRA
jgi:hypothetical protein